MLILGGILNFDSLDENQFEDFCKLLLFQIYPNKIQTLEGKGGDKGTDSFFGKINNQDTVFQFKFFTKRIDASRWKKIKESLSTAVSKRNPRKWILLLPTEFTDSEFEDWEKLKESYLKKGIELECWSIIKISSLAYQCKEVMVLAFPHLFPIFEITEQIFELLKRNPEVLVGKYYPPSIPNEAQFIGRKYEILELSKLLSQKRIISIVSIGGNGKTQLAYAIMNQNKKRFTRIIPIYLQKGITYGSFLNELVENIQSISKSDLNNIETLVLEALKIFPNVLIFVDNFEVLVENFNADRESADTEHSKIYSFIRNLPNNCKILLTSQAMENLEGEHLFRLNGLSQTDGARIFLQQASQHITKNPTKELIKKILELSKACYGHPLAIRILAKSLLGKWRL